MLESFISVARNAELSRNVAIWLTVAAASILLSAADPAAAALVAGLGAAAVLAERPLLMLAPLVGGALLEPTLLLPWAIAGVAVAHSLKPTAPQTPRLDSEPQRQLMRSRRRGEPAAVLVAHVDLPGPAAGQLLETLRATDGFELVATGERQELRAVLEGTDLDRNAIERRVESAAAGTTVRFGWASFPADGVTLETLIEEARVAAVAASITAAPEAGRESAALGMRSQVPSMAKAS